jgi:hypothetical protein
VVYTIDTLAVGAGDAESRAAAASRPDEVLTHSATIISTRWRTYMPVYLDLLTVSCWQAHTAEDKGSTSTIGNGREDGLVQGPRTANRNDHATDLADALKDLHHREMRLGS